MTESTLDTYVPLILLLMLIAEVQGAASLVIHAFGVILIISLLLHANGLSRSRGCRPTGRKIYIIK